MALVRLVFINNINEKFLLVPVILCGGHGSRLWPISRKSKPKQFIKLINKDFSMLQMTIQRLNELSIKKSGWIIVANDEHRFILADQLNEINANIEEIIIEPCSRNTAPAITLAAIHALKISDNAKLLIQTADHIIKDREYFTNLIKTALESMDPIVTFGVLPKYPETGYGYIKCGSQKNNSNMYYVEQFIEKPTLKLAKKYLKDGNYLWNSGMFILDAKIYLNEIQKFYPNIVDICEKASALGKKDLGFFRIDKKSFKNCPNISIDYAVMENSKKVTVMPFKSEWSDLGEWKAVYNEIEPNQDGNVITGDVVAYNATNSYIRSEGRLVTALGINDLIITETKDAILVASKNSSQNVKYIVETLRKKNRNEVELNSIVYRPWGNFEIILSDKSFCIKKIIVKPGKSLSLQSHKYRSEHWVVVEGLATIIKGEDEFSLETDQSTYIPKGTKHRLSNFTTKNLVLIEIQTGSYLSEDDIVRYEDLYGRK